MDEAQLELVRNWLTRASHDLSAARVLSARDEPLLDVAIYHCQQAAEKAVKGMASISGRPVSQDARHRGFGEPSREVGGGLRAVRHSSRGVDTLRLGLPLSGRVGPADALTSGLRRSPRARPAHLRFRPRPRSGPLQARLRASRAERRSDVRSTRCVSVRVQPRAEQAQRLSTWRTVHLLGLRGELQRLLTRSSIERLPRRLAQPPGLHREPHQWLQIRPAPRAHPCASKARLADRTSIHC